MTHSVLREKFLRFFAGRGHKIIPSSSLVPENDPTTLFTSSGMQPLIPYLLGQPHPEGRRLANSQKSFRSQDIEEVGDNRHTTFFEMLGNWSLGDYFKEEQLTWFYEFLTGEVGLPKEKLYVSVFEGNESVPKDKESANIWKSLGIPEDHIFYYGVKKNWWSRSGPPENMPPFEPGGPDSEVFFEFTQVEHDKKFGEKCQPNCDCGRFMEIGNSVFMQYQKQDDGTLKELAQKNVDFGGGLERILAAENNDPDVFKTDLFQPIIEEIKESTHKKYDEENKYAMRVVADHLKAAVFLIKDGVVPSNKSQGYVLRRLIRRATIKMHFLGGSLNPGELFSVSDRGIFNIYDNYFNRSLDREIIRKVLTEEIDKFVRTLDKGLKLIDKLSPFDLFQTYGFPLEVTVEVLNQQGKEVDVAQYKDDFEKHQELSRTASKGMFKGGLADSSEIITKYHTATHLLQASLRKLLGGHVHQEGSNITSERLRFDFSHPTKLTISDITLVENLVNEQINAGLVQSMTTTTYETAIASGALAFFKERYPDKVTVYSFGDFSKEICGGPHVTNTNVLGKFKIIKEEAIAHGVRRIYAKLT